MNTALNRSQVSYLTNKSGGSVAQGDVVIIDSTTASSFTTTTTASFVNGLAGVVVEPNGIANNASGMVVFGGYVPKINLSGSASLGDLFRTHSVAKQAVRHAAPLTTGDFGIVLATGTTPAAWLFNLINQGGAVSIGFEMDYVEFTSNATPTATTEGTANTVVTGNAVTYDGSTPVIVEFYANIVAPDAGAAGRTLSLYLYQDGSSIGRLGQFQGPAAAGDNKPCRVARRITPAAGSHTYSIRAAVSAGTGLVGGGAGGSGNAMPGFIRITKANP